MRSGGQSGRGETTEVSEQEEIRRNWSVAQEIEYVSLADTLAARPRRVIARGGVVSLRIFVRGEEVVHMD